jgi:hypothetical protein
MVEQLAFQGCWARIPGLNPVAFPRDGGKQRDLPSQCRIEAFLPATRFLTPWATARTAFTCSLSLNECTAYAGLP